MSNPLTGKSRSHKQNTSIRIIARKNDGVETLMSEVTMRMLSASLPCLTAEMMPHSTPTSVETTVAPTASVSVVG